MSLQDAVRTQLIEIIEWVDDSRETLSYRFPDQDKEIKRGAKLIVRESQAVQFVYLGQFGDLFPPGQHTLTTANIPLLTRLQGWKYGFESPFKADVYFVTTRLFTGNRWGTSNPVMVRDQDFGVVRWRAFGTYDFRIVDVPRFLKEVAGTDDHFYLSEFSDTMRSRVVSVFSQALATSKIPAIDAASRYHELGDALLPLINAPLKENYGLEILSFVVENVSVPPEVEQAIDKRAGMTVVGNLNDFVKYQLAQGLEKGGSGAGAIGAEMAVGMSIAQQMLNRGADGAIPELLTPADAAKVLGVDEADVIASLEAGDLKGKRIGSQWRLTRAQLTQFLQQS